MENRFPRMLPFSPTGAATNVVIGTANRLVLDSDNDTYLQAPNDDDLRFIVGAANYMTMSSFTISAFQADFVINSSGRARLWFGSTGGNSAVHYGDNSSAQYLMGVGSDFGRQWVLTDKANYTKDHDHATTTNPTLFVHSVTDPDTNNTQWVSLTHDQTNGVLATGTGAIQLSAAPLFSGAIKGTTGDPTGAEGLLTINTFDNAIKIYADGAWRTLATW